MTGILIYLIYLDLSFWMTIVLKTEPWQWTLDTSTKQNKSDLLRPHTENYQRMKAEIEKAVSGCKRVPKKLWIIRS